MNWVYALLTVAVLCTIGVFIFAVLVWPLDNADECDEHEDGGF
jgi:hypothetical protein